MTGLHTCSIRDLPADTTAARWAVVRYAMARQCIWREAGVEWRPGLAPSAELLRWWRNGNREVDRRLKEGSLTSGDPVYWRGYGWRQYVERWATEKANDDLYRRLIAEAAEVAATRGLVLACWCANGARCHRSLVAADVGALMAGDAR